MVCPVCELEHSRPGDWCPECGAYLGLLKRHPRRVVYCICLSILLGAGMFVALAWQVFAPVVRGSLPGLPGPLFWWGFALGTFFLAFGLTAKQQLTVIFRRIIGPRKA